MPANGEDLKEKFDAFIDAIASGDMDRARRAGKEFSVEIARVMEGGGGSGTGAPKSGSRTSKIPQRILDYSAMNPQNPLNVQATTKGSQIVEGQQTSFDAEGANNLRLAMTAVGVSITAGDAVCVIDNVAYLADGTDAARKCDGVCVRGTGEDRRIYWRPTGGSVVARVKSSTNVSTYGVLYLSVTAGVFTNDPDEAGLEYVQQVGHFKRWVVRQDGTVPDLAEINLNICAVGGSDAVIEFSGTAGEDIDTGELVHVDGDEAVWLADATSANRYATHVATSTALTGATVNYSAVGNHEIPTDDVDATLYTNTHYLSDTTPGAATPKPPAIPAVGLARKVWQEIGTSTEIRGTTTAGKTTIAVGIKGAVIL